MALVNERAPNRTRLLAAGLLACLVLVAVAVIALGGDGDNDGQATTRSPSGEKSSKPGGENTLDTLTADEVTFNDVYGAQIPSSPAGPAETANGRASGFTRSPAGAVLAAMHIFGRAETSPGPAVFEPTIKEQIVGPDKDKLLANVQAGYAERAALDGVTPGGELPLAMEEGRRNRSGLWAYRVDSFDESTAIANLLLRALIPGTTSPGYFNFALTVKWVDDDWRLVAPLDGSFGGVGRQLSEVPANYVVIGKD